MKTLIFAAPGYSKKSGYYYRVVRDAENFEKIGHKVQLLHFTGLKFFDFNQKKLNFFDVFKEIKKSEMLIFENISVAVFGLLFSNKKRVLVLHGSLSDVNGFPFARIKKIIYKRLLKFSVLNFDKVVTVSNAMNDYLLEMFKFQASKIVTIPNFPDSKFMENLRTSKKINSKENKLELGLKDTGFYICYCGNSQEWQRADLMCRLFEEISLISEDINFLILTNELEYFLRHKSLNHINKERITIKNVPNAEVPKYLVCSDMLYLVRKQNDVNRVACPTKAMEYLASGSPIIVSENLGDISDLARENNGLVVTENEIKCLSSLAKKIVYFISLPRPINSFFIDNTGNENLYKSI